MLTKSHFRLTKANTHIFNYRPQRSCEGYVFTPVCLSTGGLPQCMLGYHPPGAGTPLGLDPPGIPPSRSRHPPGTRHPPPGTRPPRTRHPPADGYGCGRYASYWNAFLLCTYVALIYTVVILIKLFLSLSLPPVFEFTATARMAMGSGFLVLSPSIIKASLPGHCPLPFRLSWEHVLFVYIIFSVIVS